VIALIVVVAIVLLVNLALVGTALRFRAGRGRSATRVRAARGAPTRVVVALAVLAAALFTVGVVYAERAGDVAPSGPDGLQAAAGRTAQRGISLPATGSEPLTISVSGQQWLWRYGYPDGTYSYYEMVVPVDTAVVLELGSTDVLHSWWVPELGGKFDAVPGQTNRTWFKAESEGVYEGQSASFSGPGYATMRARVRAVSAADYQDWLGRQATDIEEAGAAVQEALDTGSVSEVE
jgi:cytochrome c oxidase subunit 2